MAQTGTTFTLQSSAYQGRYLKLTCTSSQDIANNKTNISWKLESIGGSSGHYATIVRVNINGSEVYSIDKGYTYDAFPVTKGSTTGSTSVTMGSDGNKSITIYMDAAIYTSSTTRYSDTWTLNTVPRYPTISSFSVAKVSGSSTSVSVTWAGSAPGGSINKVEYSKDNGSNWTNANTTSSPFTISGLTSNTGYNFKIRVTSSASGLTATSSAYYQSTYQQPTANISTANISGYSGLSQIKVSWSSNMDIAKVEYSKDNGSTWYNAGDPNASSGNYTYTGLTEGQSYNFKVRVTATTGSCVTTSGTSSKATYKRVSGKLFVNGTQVATNNGQTGVALKNGDTLKIDGISNGANCGYKLFFENPDNQHQYLSAKATGTTAISMTAEQIRQRLQYMTSVNSQGFNVGITTLNGSDQPALYYEFFGTLSVANSNPDFSLNNWTYQDTNATTVALTGSNQILVNGFSKLRVNIGTAAGGVNYATISQYAVSGCTSGSSTTTGNIDCATATNGGTITVTARDSRGNTTPTTKTATFKDYFVPTMTSISATRNNGGVGTQTSMTFNGTWWNANFGASANTLSASYRYKSGSTWSSSRAISLTTSGNNYSFNDTIYGDLAADGFTLGTTFTIEVTITDALNGGKQWTTTLNSGTPAIAISGSNVAIGKQYDTNTGGKLQVKGEIQAETNVLSPSFESTNAAGMKTDQFFNLTHKRNTASDNWSICANDGSASLTIYPETGNTSVKGFVNLQRDKAVQFGGTNTLRANSSNNTILSANGATMYFRPNGDLSDNGAVNIATTGTISVPPTTSTHLNGAKGIGVLINGTAAGNTYTMLARQKSTNGVFNLGVWGGTYELFYIADSIVSAGSNSYTKKLDLLNESGNSSFPGNISFARGNGLDFGSGTMKGNSQYGDLHINNTGGYTYLMVNGTNILSVRSNGLYGKNGYPYYCGKDLYNNSSGTNGNITLSETSANFTFIDVFYIDSHSRVQTARTYYPSTGGILLYSNSPFAKSQTCMADAGARKFNGTAFNLADDEYGTWNSWNNSWTRNNNIKVIRVVGWRTT